MNNVGHVKYSPHAIQTFSNVIPPPPVESVEHELVWWQFNNVRPPFLSLPCPIIYSLQLKTKQPTQRIGRAETEGRRRIPLRGIKKFIIRPHTLRTPRPPEIPNFPRRLLTFLPFWRISGPCLFQGLGDVWLWGELGRVGGSYRRRPPPHPLIPCPALSPIASPGSGLCPNSGGCWWLELWTGESQWKCSDGDCYLRSWRSSPLNPPPNPPS